MNLNLSYRCGTIFDGEDNPSLSVIYDRSFACGDQMHY